MPQLTKWTPVAPGVVRNIQYRSGGWLGSKQFVLSFRIDLTRFELRLLQASLTGHPRSGVKEIAQKVGAPLAINGGYFALSPTRSLGLLIDRTKTLNPLRRADWGVFYIKRGEAHQVHTRSWRPDPTIEFAIQCGPRLVDRGKPFTFKAQTARRTAIGIRSKREVVLLVSQARMETSELARMLAAPERAGGLACQYALNLDGGSSSQFYCGFPSFKRNWTQHVKVTNAVAIQPRTKKR